MSDQRKIPLINVLRYPSWYKIYDKNGIQLQGGNIIDTVGNVVG